MAIDTLRWNGSTWVVAPVRKWNGSGWVDATVRKWNGSGWVQMYPEAIVTHTQFLDTQGCNNYKGGWENQGIAKQGNWGWGDCYGYLGISSNRFPGHGNIIQITNGTFNGKRDSSGYYNNDQKIRFFRSDVVPGTNPTNRVTGEFNAYTGAPGSGGTMSGRWVDVNNNTKDWANGVNGANQLYIFDNSKTLYLGISQANIGIDYTYQARSVVFESPTMMLMMTPDSYTELIGRTPYHSMVIFEEEAGMSLYEIMERREKGIVLPIDYTNVDDAPDIKGWVKDYKFHTSSESVTGVERKYFSVDICNLEFEEHPQISFDNINWENMKGDKNNPTSTWVSAMLPEDFNDTRDSVYFRIYNVKKDSFSEYREIEPRLEVLNIPTEDNPTHPIL